MEVLNWKNILLEWANRLKYLGRSYCSLNMVEIEAFYNEFRTNVTSKDIASKKLDSFMTSYFPEFLAEWTNEGKMSPDDYVYGFSLLMYFACVRHPDKKIHKICGEMHEESQQAVQAFLQNLLDCNSFTRETIKCVIESSVPPKLSDYVLALSPNKISEINLCPATPKSKIVNEWYVENRQLKAQVESERFERGFLETQLKQKEDEINVLHQERRKFFADIQQLKLKLNEKDTENIPVNCNDSQLEALKRRLRKDISEKEAEINKLQTQVHELASSKQHLAEKLSHVESQYNESVECSAGLTERLEQLSETCDKQQEHIRGLEMNIKDYQKYFNESNSKGNSLDSSSENLEDSFAVAMANMPNQHMSSPENLGKVVDIKLREQISLCDRLQEKCDRLEIENGRLNEQVEEHVQRTFNLEVKCRQVVDENAANVQQKNDELAIITKELESNVAQLQSLRSEFDLLTSKACENQRIIDDLTNTKTSLEQELNECQCESAELRIQLEAADAKWKTAESKRLELVSQHEEIIRQKDGALAEFKLKNRDLDNQVDELRSSLSKAEQNYANLQTQNADLARAMEQEKEKLTAELSKAISELADCQKDRDSIRQSAANLSDQIESLTVKCHNGDIQLTQLKSTNEQVLAERDQLRDKLAAIGRERIEVEVRLTSAEEIVRQMEQALAEFKLKNRGLDDQVDELRTSLSKTEQNYANLQTQNADLARAMEQEKEKLTAELSKAISELADCQKDRDSIRQSAANLSDQIESLTVKCHNGDIQLTQLKSTNEQVLAERDQLRDKLATIGSERIEAGVRLTTAEEIVRQKEQALAEFKLKNRGLDDQVDELRTSLSKAEQNYANLETQNADLAEAMEQEKEKLTAELSNAISELADCQKDRDSIQQSVGNLTTQIENLTMERQNGDIQLAQLMSTNEQVLAERDQLRDKLATIEDECVHLQARLRIAESSRVDLEAQLNHSEDEKEKLFLNLQEKLDEVEATEMTVKEWSQRYESATTENRLVCERYEKMISDLNTTVSELRVFKESLTKANDDLMKEASQMKTELESMRSEGERHMNERKHFLESIEGLNSCQNTSEAEVRQLQEKLGESNDVCVELRGKCDILEAEIESLRKSVEDLESERDTLTSRLDVAVRDVTDTRERLHQKDEEMKEMSKLIDSLKSESETSLLEKVKVETELRNNMDRLQRIGQELEEKKKESAEASQLVETLRNEVEQLKVTEMAMTAKNSELSDAHEVLVKKLESAENSKESLSVQCTSLAEELKAVRIEFTEIECKLSDQCSQAIERDDEVKALKLQVDSLKAEIVSISEVAAQKQSDLNAIIQTNQQEMATISSKAEEQQSSIKELTVQNENLSQAMAELSGSLSQNKIECESYQRSSTDYKAEIEELARSKDTLNLRVIELTNETKKLADELQKAKRENVSLTDENVDLVTEIEKVRTEFSNSDTRNRDKIESLKSELNRLETANSANHQRIDELQKSVEAKSNDNSNKENYAKLEADLKIAMSDLEAKIQECRQSHDLNAQLIHDSKILSAKLTQLRKTTAEQAETWQKERTALIEQNDKRCTEIRFEMEGKLSKMKERMKDIYNEETSKSKEKHEKQDRELTNYKHQCQLLNDKNDQYVTHVRSISAQLYKLNEQNLELKKETEFLKNKLRLAESNPSRQPRLFLPPDFGSNLRIEMEDEQGEIFNNKHLDELKSGTMSTLPVGRESIRLSELQQRNSMAAKHLRSTYAAQYGDQNLKEEDIAMPYFNDSMFSNNQLDVRRGTLYQRPGPPTPSKNGGRLSFGGSIVSASDLFPKDILREQNTNNAKTKTTPGKLMSMFSSSKHKENDMRKAITKPIYKTFTSTPRRKSIWAGERKSILAIKLNSTELTDLCDDDDVASVVSNDSLLSKTSNRRRSITHQFSIISKSKQVSAVSSLIHKNRCEYRKKNHSKRQKGFEQSREIFWKMDDDGNEDDDDDSGGGGNNLQMVLSKEIGGIQQDDPFALDLRPSEKFEILTTRTVSEHPYSNEPTAIEAVEASEGSLTSSSLSKTMGNIIMYGKIPRITANEVPHRELIHLNQRSGSIWLKWMGLTKECFLVLALLVVYASYVVWNSM